MTKKLYSLLVLLILTALVLGACGGTEPTEEPMEEPPAEEEPVEAEEATFKACQVTDTGGIDDKSFNATAWKGFTDAEDQFGVDIQYLESQQQTDYDVNINAFLDEDCDLIVSVGFLLGDATAAAAEANPEQPFAIVDVDYLDAPNLRGSGFNIYEATYLAGYLAAGMTQTGVVGTYGGLNIPTVTVFMDGFVLGVEKYNEVHGTAVSVLGWDIETQDGLFTGNFESTDDGRTKGEDLLDEGADIIMPVAGPVGAGTLAAMEERGSGLLIGVDTDWSAPYAYPEQADYILASALKGMDGFVTDTIEMVMNDEFEGGTYVGTLENGGVGLAYGSAWEENIPAELKTEIEDLQAGIIAGEIVPLPAPAEEGEAEEEAEPAAEFVMPAGTEEDPILWAVVPSGETDRVVTGFEELAAMIYDETDLVIQPFVATEYAGVIEAACASPPKAHMTSLATFAYILAADKGCVGSELVSVRYGTAFYNGQIFVRADSGIEELADLDGKTFCRADPQSTSSWVIPSITLQAEGVELSQVVDAGSHDAAVAGVYNGDCDAGASYVDARTTIEEEYPDVMDVIKVIALTADIPNDGVQFVTGFDPDVKQQIVDALLAIAETEEGQAALDTAYSWTALEVHDDTFYDPFRQVLDAAGISPEDLQ